MIDVDRVKLISSEATHCRCQKLLSLGQLYLGRYIYLYIHMDPKVYDWGLHFSQIRHTNLSRTPHKPVIRCAS